MSIQNLTQANWLQAASTQRVFSLLADGGHVARVVGGAVRNTLLGLPISDIDFAATALPDELIALAKQANIKYLPTGLQHGTVTLMIDGEPFEVTTLRRDEQTDGRHAVVAFTDNWAEDAARRDFTVNALYADADGSLFDPLNGLPDLQQSRIAFIGKADERISEDYLRILRFFRFFGQYGEGAIDQIGLEACIRGGSGLVKISGERIHVELLKMLISKRADEATVSLYDSGLFLKIFSQVSYLARFKAMMALERQLGLAPNSMRRLAALFIMVAEDIEALDKRLRLSKQQKRQLGWFASTDAPSFKNEQDIEKMLYYEGAEAAKWYFFRQLLDHPSPQAKVLYQKLELKIKNWEIPTFPLKGGDLIKAGYKPGTQLGKHLKQLEQKWISSGFLLSKAALLAKL